MKKLKYISLFAGIGGFDLALNRLGHVCVWANEWDKYAAQIYRARFSNNSNKFRQGKTEGGLSTKGESNQSQDSKGSNNSSNTTSLLCSRDITTVKTSEIPDHDLLVGGFPCQAFSIAGKRRGFDDTRGTLFFDIARILKDKQPKYFILENVKGLLSHNKGDTFRTIIATLTELGYDLQWQVLNSKNFGVPQNRERVFIVGHLRGEPRPEVFPISTSSGQIDELQGLQVGAITARRGTAKSDGDYVVESIRQTQEMKQIVGGSQGYRVYDPQGISSTLAGEAGGVGAKTGLYAIKYGQNNPDRNGNTSNEMFTLKASSTNAGVSNGVSIRRLTPLECERLQSFPDGWTEGISDTQRYKCLGNAVTVNVITAIAERLI